MSKLVIGFIPKDSKEFKYIIDNSEYIGHSTIEALSSYFLKNSITPQILLLRPESLDRILEIELKKRLMYLGIEEENIRSYEILITGGYEGKRFITDPKIISDFIFLSLKETYKEEYKEIILDVSRGLNFLVLSAIEAYRRFIVSLKAQNLLHKEDIPEFKYVYLTPLEEGGIISEIRLEKIDSPLFFDYFKNYNKLPFNFKETEKELYSEFNFIKEILKLVNTCIYTMKRGFILAFLTILPWDKIEELLKKAEEKLSITRLQNLNSLLTEYKGNTIERKYSLNYPLGNLWIYIYFLKSFWEIYSNYKDEIKIENNLKWVKIETLQRFNEEIIEEVFKEYGTDIIVSKELKEFQQSFQRGENRDLKGKGGHSDITRNFNAHAGLILDFLEQNKVEHSIAYKKEKYKDICGFLVDWENEIKF